MKKRKLLIVLVVASFMIAMLFQRRYPRPLAPAGYFLAAVADVLPEPGGLRDTVVLVRQDDLNDGRQPERALLVSVGGAEGASIMLDLSHAKVPHPLTLDLLFRILNRLGLQVDGAFLHRVHNEFTLARVELGGRLGSMSFDCRPSDALALAVRAGAPVWLEEKLFQQSATSFAEVHAKLKKAKPEPAQASSI